MTENARGAPRSRLWLLLPLALAAYANSFAGVFLFDDHAAILADPRVQSLAAFLGSLGHSIRPLTKATFLVDWQLFGEHPAGYHVLNVLLHLASGSLLYRVLLRLSTVGPTAAECDDARQRIAFWTTMLFLVHPIATETVTYISGRPTGLMTCGYLAAFLLFLRARADDSRGSSQLATVGCAMACVALSLLAKETTIVFPAVLALYEMVLRRPAGSELRTALTRIHAPVWSIVILFLSLAAFNARYIVMLRNGLARGWLENVLTQAQAVVYAMTLFVRPWQSNFDHDLPLHAASLQGQTLISIAAIACIIGTAAVLVRRLPLFSFGILWFFLNLLPTNSFFGRYDVLSERNLYLPSIGLYLAIVVGAIGLAGWLRTRLPAALAVGSWLAGSRVIVVRAALAALVVILLGTTVRRNAIYAEPVAFWSDAVAKSPNKARPHTNLGYALFMAGDMDRAIQEFRIALRLDPLNPVAQSNLLEVWTRNAPR